MDIPYRKVATITSPPYNMPPDITANVKRYLPLGSNARTFFESSVLSNIICIFCVGKVVNKQQLPSPIPCIQPRSVGTVLERWGVEEPATNEVTDDPMPKGKGAGPRPYVLYHKRWGHNPERRRSTTTAHRVVHTNLSRT